MQYHTTANLYSNILLGQQDQVIHRSNSTNCLKEAQKDAIVQISRRYMRSVPRPTFLCICYWYKRSVSIGAYFINCLKEAQKDAIVQIRRRYMRSITRPAYISIWYWDNKLRLSIRTFFYIAKKGFRKTNTRQVIITCIRIDIYNGDFDFFPWNL